MPSVTAPTTSGPTGWVWKAPMSGVESSGSPRWSVRTPVTATPSPIAGLPVSRAMVWVGPP